mmetsp:Transcript_2673/g.8380  ORF Transcript_2673/g.8380 Transcript_2673/m.8380 type:complete len:326 (+) Transcript_2673:29-1006(+)
MPNNKRWLAWLLVLCRDTEALSTTSPKESLRSLFESRVDGVLADPVTKEALRVEQRFVGDGLTRRYLSSSGEYGVKAGTYVDLVDPKAPPSLAELRESVRDSIFRSRSERVRVDTFRSPVTAFLYERGWRQNFQRSGFPGIDREFDEVCEFFDLASARSAVVDLSCGTGLMTRRLKDVVPTRLIAADFSEAMLLETRRRLGADDRVELVRVDVAALPLRDDAVDAVHAGAAMHCWPRLEQGLAEIVRVLKPQGGQFFATTFLTGALGTDARSASAGFRFFTLDELRTLATDAGFTTVDVRREGSYCAVLKASLDAPAFLETGDGA